MIFFIIFQYIIQIIIPLLMPTFGSLVDGFEFLALD